MKTIWVTKYWRTTVRLEEAFHSGELQGAQEPLRGAGRWENSLLAVANVDEEL